LLLPFVCLALVLRTGSLSPLSILIIESRLRFGIGQATTRFDLGSDDQRLKRPRTSQPV
jgi:hypothetical protein